MVSFLTLPNELLNDILDLLGPVSYLALSAVNAAFQQLAQPLLYQELSWPPSDPSVQARSVYLLLRTLAERPDLAASVDRATFEGRLPASFWSTPQEPDINSADLNLIKSLIQQQRHSAPQFLHTQLDYGVPDVFFALLVGQLRNVRCLSIGEYFERAAPLTMEIIRSGVRRLDDAGQPIPRTRFKRLTQFAFCSEKIRNQNDKVGEVIDRGSGQLTRYPVKSGNVEPFLFADTITSLSLWLQNEEDLILPSINVSSKLTTLVLYHSEVRVPTLKKLLGYLHKLQDLEYHYHIGCCEIPERQVSTYLDCGKLGEALDQVRTTIRKIVVRAQWYGVDGALLPEQNLWWGVLPGRQLNSFRNYPRLQSLTTPLFMIFGWSPRLSTVELSETLPPGLEHLCLTDDLEMLGDWEWRQHHYLARFQPFLQDWRQCTPQLKDLSFVLEDDDDYHHSLRPEMDPAMPDSFGREPTAGSQRELARMCQNAGVEFWVDRDSGRSRT